MYNSMNEYHQRIHWSHTEVTERTTKILPHVNYLRLYSRTNLDVKITLHRIMQKSLPNDHNTNPHYHISVQAYIHPSFAQEKPFHFIHKSTKLIIAPSIGMSSFCQPASSPSPCSWGSATSKEWNTMTLKSKWEPKVCTLGSPLHTKRHATTLL